MAKTGKFKVSCVLAQKPNGERFDISATVTTLADGQPFQKIVVEHFNIAKESAVTMQGMLEKSLGQKMPMDIEVDEKELVKLQKKSLNFVQDLLHVAEDKAAK